MVDADEIDHMIADLEVETSQFHENAGLVNELLERAEAKLVAARPGVEHWLPFDIEPTNECECEETDERTGDIKVLYTYHEAYRFGFARQHDDTWGLCVKIVQVRNDGSEFMLAWHRAGDGYSSNAPVVPVPIRNAPIAVRIESLQNVHDLIRRIKRIVSDRNTAIRKAASMLKQTD